MVLMWWGKKSKNIYIFVRMRISKVAFYNRFSNGGPRYFKAVDFCEIFLLYR